MDELTIVNIARMWSTIITCQNSQLYETLLQSAAILIKHKIILNSDDIEKISSQFISICKQRKIYTDDSEGYINIDKISYIDRLQRALIASDLEM